MALYNALKNNNLIFTTSIPKYATYIMSDGKFFDIDNSRETIFAPEFLMRNFITHNHVDAYLRRLKLTEEQGEKLLVKTDNAIALNDGSYITNEVAYFVLPDQKPTNAQFSSLGDWITNLSGKKEFVMMKGRRHECLNVYPLVSLQNDEGYTPEQIVQEIKKMYATAE